MNNNMQNMHNNMNLQGQGLMNNQNNNNNNMMMNMNQSSNYNNNNSNSIHESITKFLKSLPPAQKYDGNIFIFLFK